MLDQATTSGTSDALAVASGSASTVADTSAAPTGNAPTPSESSAGPATTGADQGTASQPTTDADPLAGVPTLDELNQLDDSTPYKKSLAQMREAIEKTFKPQLAEFTEKLKPLEPFVPHLERFQSPDELASLVKLNDSLFGFERDPDDGQLVPATQTFAADLTQQNPRVANFLAADLMEGEMRHPSTGQPVTRINYALEVMAQDPERRAAALKLLGGVEPSSIAPTWQPSAEELAVIRPELQEIYKQLPYDEREELKLASPDFINRQLEKEKFQSDLIAQNKQAQELQARQQAERESYIRQRAAESGNKAVESGFRAGLADFQKSVVERAAFVAPIDPQSEMAKSMSAEQIAAYNADAQQINQGMGNMISMVTIALSHPDTSWAMAEFLKGLGVEESALTSFNEARQEYANLTRDLGELQFHAQNGQPNAGLGTLQSNANRAMKTMKGQANLISKPLFSLVSKLFEMKATSYNQTLNSGAGVRPPVNGNAFDPTRAPATLPSGNGRIGLSREEINRLYG